VRSYYIKTYARRRYITRQKERSVIPVTRNNTTVIELAPAIRYVIIELRRCTYRIPYCTHRLYVSVFHYVYSARVLVYWVRSMSFRSKIVRSAQSIKYVVRNGKACRVVTVRRLPYRTKVLWIKRDYKHTYKLFKFSVFNCSKTIYRSELSALNVYFIRAREIIFYESCL